MTEAAIHKAFDAIRPAIRLVKQGKPPKCAVPVRGAAPPLEGVPFNVGKQGRWKKSNTLKEAKVQAKRLKIAIPANWKDIGIIDELSLAKTHLPTKYKITIGKMPMTHKDALAWAKGRNTIHLKEKWWRSQEYAHWYYKEAAKRKLLPKGYNTLSVLRHEETHYMFSADVKIVEGRYGWDVVHIWNRPKAQRAMERYVKRYKKARIRKHLGKYAAENTEMPIMYPEILAEARGQHLSGIRIPAPVLRMLKSAGAAR